MPIVPLAMLGLPALLAWGRTGGRVWPAAAAGVAAIYSAAVNLVGALGGTMFCDTARFAFPRYLRVISSVGMHQFPLAPACAGLATLGGLALALSFWLRRRAARALRAS